MYKFPLIIVLAVLTLSGFSQSEASQITEADQAMQDMERLQELKNDPRLQQNVYLIAEMFALEPDTLWVGLVEHEKWLTNEARKIVQNYESLAQAKGGIDEILKCSLNSTRSGVVNYLDAGYLAGQVSLKTCFRVAERAYASSDTTRVCMDPNSDGVVNLSDVVKMARYIGETVDWDNVCNEPLAGDNDGVPPGDEYFAWANLNPLLNDTNPNDEFAHDGEEFASFGPTDPLVHRPVVLAAGSNHTCASLRDGSAKCWGLGADGQLGNGSTDNQPLPVEVTKLTSDDFYVRLAAGIKHTCMIMADLSTPNYYRYVRCWGGNDFGQIGDGTIGGQYLIPTPVYPTTGDLWEISAGDNFTCVHVEDATELYCWGEGTEGQLGNGDWLTSPTAVKTIGTYPGDGATLVEINSAGNHSCATWTNGFGSCWGGNTFGQLGLPDFVNRNRIDLGITRNGEPLLAGVMIGTGTTHGCTASDSIWNPPYCWGSNTYGELGRGSFSPSYTNVPEVVEGMGGILEVQCGKNFTCARSRDGSLQCWGKNDYGQLGNGTFVDSPTPITVPGLQLVTKIALGDNHMCAMVLGGRTYCFGDNTYGQLGIDPESGSNEVILEPENESSEDGHVEEPTIPNVVDLWGASPNPFNPRTTISFLLHQSVSVNLEIFDASGHHVKTLIDSQDMLIGTHSAHWNGRYDSGRRAASGVYFFRLKAGRSVQTGKMALLR